MRSLEICTQKIFNNLTKQSQKMAADFVLKQRTIVSSAQSPASKVYRPTSSVRRPGSIVQRPGSSIQSPTSRVQRLESSVQSPGFRVQHPESSAQSPAFRVQRPTFTSRIQEFRYAFLTKRPMECQNVDYFFYRLKAVNQFHQKLHLRWILEF